MRASPYPVGATWRYVGPFGDVGVVRLDQRLDLGVESWSWRFWHADGSGVRGDSGPTRRLAASECSSCFHYRTGHPKVRFRREQ